MIRSDSRETSWPQKTMMGAMDMERFACCFGLDRLQTPIGTALLVTDADGVLCALDWDDHEPRMRELLRLQHGAVVLKEAFAPREMTAALSAYFAGDLSSLSAVKWRIAGTPFQRRVWTALASIPPGTTVSYGALAARLNVAKAVRAVGHANGANPISVVIPCHRMVGADGSLVKYGGGLPRKRWLLAHEGVMLHPASNRLATVVRPPASPRSRCSRADATARS